MGQNTDKTLIQRIAGNFFILLGTIGVATALNLMTTTINARAIGKEGVGLLAIYQSAALLVSGIFSFGTHQAVIRLGSKWIDSKEGLSRIISVSFLLDQTSSALGALCFFGFAGFFLSPPNQSDSCVMWNIPYALVVWSSGTSCALGVIRLFNRFKVFSSITLFFSASNLFFSILLFALQLPIDVYMATFAILLFVNNLCVNAYLFILLREKGLSLSFFSKPLLRSDERRRYFELLAASYVSSTTDICVRHLDVIVLGRIADASDAGVYSVSKQIASGVSKLLAPISTIMFPELSALAEKKDLMRGRRLFLATAFLLLAFSAIGLSVVYILGDILMSFIFGEFINNGIVILLITFLAVILKIGVTIFAGFTASYGRPRINGYAFLFSGASYFCLVFYLVNSFGAIGAASSQLFYSTILMVWIATSAALLLRLPNDSRKAS